MKLLLDTHIWIWSWAEPGKLSPQVRKALANPVNEIWLSAICFWELLALVEKRRLVLSDSPEVWLKTFLC